MRFEPIAPHCVVEFPPPHFTYEPILDEGIVFRRMRDEYLARHLKYNGCMVALELCSKGFGIPICVLRGKDRHGQLGAARVKLMAFSRIVSLDGDVVNTWSGIARAFHRTHAAVIYSVRRQGPQIIAALEKSK